MLGAREITLSRLSQGVLAYRKVFSRTARGAVSSVAPMYRAVGASTLPRASRTARHAARALLAARGLKSPARVPRVAHHRWPTAIDAREQHTVSHIAMRARVVHVRSLASRVSRLARCSWCLLM